MKYSNVILTDENFDTEIETLATIIGIPFTKYENFVEILPSGFTCQTHEKGFEEWICFETVPSFSSDCASAYQKGYLAYEFGNGFIIFNFEFLL